MFHCRETRGLEVDLLIDRGERLDAVEIKSAETISADFFKNLHRFSERLGESHPTRIGERYLLYGGEVSHKRSRAQVLSWHDVQRIPANC